MAATKTARSNATPVALNQSQVLILDALARAGKPLTIEQIEAKVGPGVAVNSGNIGPVFKETLPNYPDSLYGMGFVRCLRPEGEPTTFEITPRGQKAAGQFATRKPMKQENKIPASVLDKAVIPVKRARTYGLELFTKSDLDEIKAACGADWDHVTHDDLRLQICNRRKQGAFANGDHALPEWYAEYRDGDHFAGIEKAAVAAAKTCAVNPEHTEGLKAYHRTFATLGKEKGKDVIVLCPACAKRLRASFPPVPAQATADKTGDVND